MKKIIVPLVSLIVSVFVIAGCSSETVEKPVDPNSALRIEAMKEVHNKERQMLTTYGVIDKEKGIYRIPVERAMEVIASEADKQ